MSIIGWHDGGAAALIAAARYPDLVQNVVVWGAYAYVTQKDIDIYNGKYCSRLTRKPVFGVCDRLILKTAWSATEAS